MNKEEALWVVIRAIGLVFLVLTLISLTLLISSGAYLIYLHDLALTIETGSTLAKSQAVAQSTTKTLISKRVSEVILYGIAAFYFMRRGKFVYRVISK